MADNFYPSFCRVAFAGYSIIVSRYAAIQVERLPIFGPYGYNLPGTTFNDLGLLVKHIGNTTGPDLARVDGGIAISQIQRIIFVDDGRRILRKTISCKKEK
jgi:hypothetical protein